MLLVAAVTALVAASCIRLNTFRTVESDGSTCNKSCSPKPSSVTLKRGLVCEDRRVNGSPEACTRLHFRRLTFPWTDPGLGNCNYLDTCRHMHNCKFVHYELDTADVSAAAGRNGKGAATRPSQRDGPPVPTYLQANHHPFVSLLNLALSIGKTAAVE